MDTGPIRREVWLSDVNGQHQALFLLFDEFVIGIPMVSMTAEYLTNQALEIWVPPSCRYQPGGFLQYLAKVAAIGQYPAYFSVSSQYGVVTLTRYMQASDLAAVTGYDVENVRKLLHEFLAFEPESEKVA